MTKRVIFALLGVLATAHLSQHALAQPARPLAGPDGPDIAAGRGQERRGDQSPATQTVPPGHPTYAPPIAGLPNATPTVPEVVRPIEWVKPPPSDGPDPLIPVEPTVQYVYP